MKSVIESELLEDISDRVLLTVPQRFLYRQKDKTHNDYEKIASVYRKVFINHGLGWNDKCENIVKAIIQRRCPRQEAKKNSSAAILEYLIRAFLDIPNTVKGANCINNLRNKTLQYKKYSQQANDIIRNDKEKVELIKAAALRELLSNEEEEEEIEKALREVLKNEDNKDSEEFMNNEVSIAINELPAEAEENWASELERTKFLAQPIKSLPDIYIDKNVEKPLFDLTRFFPELKTKKETNENNVNVNSVVPP